MSESNRIADIKKRAQLVVKAADMVASWDDDYREAVLEVLGEHQTQSSSSDKETKPCELCGKPLVVSRKPTLHYNFQHKDIPAAEKKRILDNW